MASHPGPLTHWPWQKLGNFKYGLLLPWVAQSAHNVAKSWNAEGQQMVDHTNLSIIPLLFLRLLHAQLWITVSRIATASGGHTITRKPLDFEQVDRECNWDDQILLTTLIFYTMNAFFPWASHLPWWNTKGVVLLALIHMGPVEFIYYWFHRALHHHLLYSRYHSHHHASVVTQPITSVIHPFAEELAYFVLFSIPLITIAVTGTGSVTAMAGYLMFIDFMNYLGHCNFEVVPNWLFDVFPLLKYLMYTPSFHSLHHTQFRTNYCLFMPLYDFIYGTVDKSSKKLYQSCIVGIEEAPDVVHLTHMTNLESIYHLRMGSASLSSKPYSPKWYMWLLWPLTLASFLVTWLCGSIFIVEKNRMKKLVVETWAVPRFSFQYKRPSQRVVINGFIEKAVLDAEKAGAKMITFGLLNQGDELNNYGKLYIQNNPQLKIKIVDGTSLAAAVVLNSIPKGTKQALLMGSFSKMSCVLAHALCSKGVQLMVHREEYKLLKAALPEELQQHLELSHSYHCKVVLVGDGLRDEVQRMALKDSKFIPFSQFPPKAIRRDCTYYYTPALMAPKAYENQHSCENWLPRRAMSAWRAAGVIHALEGWEADDHEDVTMELEKIWLAAIKHGFQPMQHP
ncbi:hypothetical protein HPP92_022087 [Vanilla planifolia]|uniref:aldehyde oxygenase (deformylating) n=1 Tax=Vanilla planifolia TaxID=51239 RepID=A0A835PQU1_VANPL|nr:hypothetical protein HPP92_022087 [Vanilla planifolia]